MLSNAYFLAKFRFDTAENEPAKNLQNFCNFAKKRTAQAPGPPRAEALRRAAGIPAAARIERAGVGPLALGPTGIFFRAHGLRRQSRKPTEEEDNTNIMMQLPWI